MAATKQPNQHRGTIKIIGKVIRDGREVWRVAIDGRITEITTRRSSSAAMDEAMVIYRRALQRLADR